MNLRNLNISWSNQSWVPYSSSEAICEIWAVVIFAVVVVVIVVVWWWWWWDKCVSMYIFNETVCSQQPVPFFFQYLPFLVIPVGLWIQTWELGLILPKSLWLCCFQFCCRNLIQFSRVLRFFSNSQIKAFTSRVFTAFLLQTSLACICSVESFVMIPFW